MPAAKKKVKRKKVVKVKLTSSDKYFIHEHTNLTAEQLSLLIEKPVEVIAPELANALAPVISPRPVEPPKTVSVHEPKPTREKKRELFGRRDGVAVMTPLASELGDEINPMSARRRISNNGPRDTSGFVHRPLRND